MVAGGEGISLVAETPVIWCDIKKKLPVLNI
jgi:hypothetical protein